MRIGEEYKEIIRERALKGEKFNKICKDYLVLNRKGEEVPITSVQAGRLFTHEDRRQFALARKEINIRQRKFLIPIEEAVFTYRQPRIHQLETDIGIYDLWNFPNELSSINKYGEVVAENEDIHGSTTLNIPFINFQPAKRIQQIAHSVVKWKKAKGAKGPKLQGVVNFVKLDNPEQPIVNVKRHDVDTLNATIGFANNDRDSYLTADDTCIISTEFAEKFMFSMQVDQEIVISPEDKEEIVAELNKRKTRDYPVWAGDIFGNKEIIEKYPDLFKQNIIKHDGVWRITTVKEVKKHPDLWVLGGKIAVHRELQIGDKLRSLSGLKVVICQIRDQNDNKDIIIHPNQIKYNDKDNIKGAVVKELQTCGKVMVGMRQDEVNGNNESLTAGSSISADVFPILKLYTPDMLKRVMQKNSIFADYLGTIHMVLDDNTIKISPKDIGKKAGHYCWTDNYLTDSSRFIGKKSDYKFMEIEFGDEAHQCVIWENLLIPSWVNHGRYQDRKWREPDYIEYAGKTIEEVQTTSSKKIMKYKGKSPYLINPHRRVDESPAQGELNFPKVRLFPKVKEGCILRALPTEDENADYIVLGEYHREKFGNKATIWREPCVGQDNIWSMPVRYEETNPFTVRIPPRIVKAAYGDFDGDPWSVIADYDEGLDQKTHNIGKYKYEVVEKFDLNTLELKERTEDELVEEAISWKEDYRAFKQDTRNLGGLRKRASFWADTNEKQKQILRLATVLEVTLKPELYDKKEIEDTKEKLDRFIPKRTKENGQVVNVVHPLSKILNKFHRDAWRDLPGTVIPGFWLDLIGKEDITAELREGKTEYIGGI